MIKGILFGLASMAGWGVADFLAARASKDFGTLITFFWVQISGLLLLFPLAPWLEEGATWNKSQAFLLLAGVILFTCVYLLLYRGFERGLVAVVSPIFSAYVIIAVLVGLVLFREHLTALQGGAVALVVVGILLAASDWRQIAAAERTSLTRGLPEALSGMLLAGIFFSILTFLARQLGWFGPFLRLRTGCALIAGLLLLLTRQKASLAGKDLLLVILAGIFDSLAFLAFNLGIRNAPAAIVAPIGGSFSLLTVFLVLVFSKERPAPNQWAGIAAIVAGIVWISIV